MAASFHVQIAFGTETLTLAFAKDAIRIGRRPDNDVVLPDGSIADRYARLELVVGPPASFRMRPFVGQERPIANGDTVALGPYALTPVGGPAPDEREAKFLEHLTQNPADDTTRLVYIDWLEENGRTNAAKFVRAQVQLATLAPDTPDFLREAKTIERLAHFFPIHWRRTIARPPIENCGIRFELQCPKQWGELTPTTDPTQRFCGSCQRNVYFASSVPTARKLALLGHCVVVDVAQPRRPGDLEAERFLVAGRMAPPSESPGRR